MNEIRAFDQSDVQAVAGLQLKVFRGLRDRRSGELENYFRNIFFENPWRQDDLPSLVYVHDGKIVGFLGVVPRPMLFERHRIRAAVASQLMVDQEAYRGLAGLQLLRRFLDGPQDLSFTDGATEAAFVAWTAAGAHVAPLLSLEWTRVLRPAGYFRGLALRHPAGSVRKTAHIVGPIRGLIDAAATRLQLSPYRMDSSQQGEPVEVEALFDCLRRIGSRHVLEPVYEIDTFRWLIEQAASARALGRLRTAIVRNAKQAPIGWYIYYGNPGGIAQVLQIGSAPRSFNLVLQALIADGWDSGSVALRGQAVPANLLDLTTHRCALKYPGNGVLVHSRDLSLLNTVLTGRSALSRLDGDWWMRFTLDDWR